MLIGISVNHLKSLPESTTALGVPVATGAYLYTLIFVRIQKISSMCLAFVSVSVRSDYLVCNNLAQEGFTNIFEWGNCRNFLRWLLFANVLSVYVFGIHS